MVDLSKYAEDKDGYILRTEINDDFTKFKVVYASGRVEEFDFSIHNYQVYLYIMEDQFNRYSKCYKREIGMEYTKEMKSAMLWSLIDIASIFFTCNMDFAIGGKIVLAFIAVLALLHNVSKIGMAKQKLQHKAMKTVVVESYIANREKFSVDVKDPISGRDEKWYVIDFNSLDQFNSEFELFLSSIPIQVPEFRDEIRKGFSGGETEGAITIK